jgi:hypothetical protein
LIDHPHSFAVVLFIRGFDNFAQAAPFSGGFLAFRDGADLIRARWARKKD